VLENSILRRIFNLRKKMWQQDRQLHNAELCTILFTNSDQIKMHEVVGQTAGMEGVKNV
jgi:hypothetical protein